MAKTHVEDRDGAQSRPEGGGRRVIWLLIGGFAFFMILFIYLVSDFFTFDDGRSASPATPSPQSVLLI